MEKNLKKTRIGILVVAYNAVTTLTKMLSRIPEQVLAEVEEIVVFDDASKDDTFILAHGYKSLKNFSKLHVYQNEKNLGYGGNQKKGYEYFIKKGFDVVVLLHGDGQYAPELLKEMYQPIADGRADAVFGSRMMNEHGGPLKGGMPLYKFVGNKILTGFENRMLSMNLTEFHSGYRAYSCAALKNIEFGTCSDDFHFDTEMIVKLNHQGYRILEIPIPTYYGNEICYVNGMKYAFNVVKTVKAYRLAIAGIRNKKTYAEYFKSYPLRSHRYSSHDLIVNLAGTGKKILDLGCGSGELARELIAAGNQVMGVDIALPKNLGPGFVQSDLESPQRFSGIDLKTYDLVICADILEHLKSPESLLKELRDKIKPGAMLIVSLPNIANIVTRLALLFGRFSYADAGIMDRGHLRFFTLASARELIRGCGFKIVKVCPTPLPIFLFSAKGSLPGILGILEMLFYAKTRLFKTLLAYQFVFVAMPEESS